MEVFKFYLQKRMKDMFDYCNTIEEENKLYHLTPNPINISSNTFAFPPFSSFQLDGYKAFEDQYEASKTKKK